MSAIKRQFPIWTGGGRLLLLLVLLIGSALVTTTTASEGKTITAIPSSSSVCVCVCVFVGMHQIEQNRAVRYKWIMIACMMIMWLMM